MKCPNIRKLELFKSTTERRIERINKIIKNRDGALFTNEIINNLQRNREELQIIINGCNSLLQNPNICIMNIDTILDNYEQVFLNTEVHIPNINNLIK